MIRILHVVSILNTGGMENYIMNLYRNIDRNIIQFDFLVHHTNIGFFEDEIKTLGGNVFHMSVLDDKNILKYKKNLKCFFEEHKEYKIVHGHLSSLAYFYLGAAKKAEVPYRISHSHGAGFLKSPKGYVKYLLFRFAKVNANFRFACSTEAGNYLFKKEDFEFIPNAVDSKRFEFDLNKRIEMRSELNVSNNFVIGHVGRFNLEKNHMFLLELLKKILNVLPNTKLLLLGEGELKNEIICRIHHLQLENYVILAGVHKDCENYYQAMDVFVLPSLFEGLPLTGIEAQYNGLTCLFSDAITKDTIISDLVSFLAISDSNRDAWVTELVEIASNGMIRTNAVITTDDFDITIAAKKMSDRYFKMLENNE
ncbi:glycosyltransferase [Amedibacillus sp. YH-ame6]